VNKKRSCVTGGYGDFVAGLALAHGRLRVQRRAVRDILEGENEKLRLPVISEQALR